MPLRVYVSLSASEESDFFVFSLTKSPPPPTPLPSLTSRWGGVHRKPCYQSYRAKNWRHCADNTVPSSNGVRLTKEKKLSYHLARLTNVSRRIKNKPDRSSIVVATTSCCDAGTFSTVFFRDRFCQNNILRKKLKCMLNLCEILWLGHFRGAQAVFSMGDFIFDYQIMRLTPKP